MPPAGARGDDPGSGGPVAATTEPSMRRALIAANLIGL
jgi:hypothetical protein